MTAAAVAIAQATLYGLVLVAQRRMAFGPLALGPVLLYLAATAGLFGGYAWAVRRSRSATLAGRERRVLLAAPALVWLALALAPPSLSMDVLSYLAHGRQLAGGLNPYTTATSEVDATPYGRQLRTWGWLPVHGPTPYGPLWTRAEVWAFGTPSDHSMRGGDIATQVRRVKVPVALAGLLAAFLIWHTLGQLAPAHQLAGTVLYLWNPLVAMELAAEGHNDAAMLVLTLFGLLLFVRGHPARGSAAVTAAALVKLNALVVAPPLAGYVLRQRGVVWVRAALGVLILGWLGWLAYGNLWAGSATFAGLRLHAAASVTPSTGGVLYWFLTRTHAAGPSAQAVSLVLTAALTAATLVLSVRVTDVRTAVVACGQLALTVVVLASSYWPWYLVLPIGLLALAPYWRLSVPFVMVFSVAGRLVAPIDRLRLNGLTDWPTEVVVTTVVGLWLPAAVALALIVRQWRLTAPPTGYRSASARLRKLMLPMAPPGTPAERMSSRR